MSRDVKTSVQTNHSYEESDETRLRPREKLHFVSER